MIGPAATTRRLRAFLIDGLIAAAPAAVAATAAVQAAADRTADAGLQALAGLAAVLVALPVVFSALILIGVRTPGVRVAKLTVLGPDGTVAGRGRLLRREMARLGLINLPMLVAGAGLAGLAPCLRRGRPWHDVASGTTVLTERLGPDVAMVPAIGTRRFARSGAEFATFSERGGGWLIDIGLIGTVWLTAVAVASLATDNSPDRDVPQWLTVFALVSLPVIDIGYRVTALAWRGTTVGLGAVGYVVRREEDEGDVHLGRALRREVVGRWIVVYGSLIVLVGVVLIPLDLFFPLWQPQRQTLHDQIGSTVVVRGEPRPWRRRARAPAEPADTVVA